MKVKKLEILIRKFEEEINCQKENKSILSNEVNVLGAMLRETKSKTIPKWKIHRLQVFMKKTIKLQKRIDVVLNEISGELISQHKSLKVTEN